MNMVQPGSATVKTNGVAVPAAMTRAVRCWPVIGRPTATGTSTVPSPPATGSAGVVRPSPSTRIGVGSVPPV